MKTHIRPEWVRFGTVQYVGRKSVVVELESIGGCKGTMCRRFCFSRLRRAETLHGKVVFSTGPTCNVREGDSVACVPQDDNYGLWVLRREYEHAMANVQQAAPSSIPATSEPERTSIKEIERKTGEMAGHDRIAEFYRRHPSWKPRNGVRPVPI